MTGPRGRRPHVILGVAGGGVPVAVPFRLGRFPAPPLRWAIAVACCRRQFRLWSPCRPGSSLRCVALSNTFRLAGGWGAGSRALCSSDSCPAWLRWRNRPSVLSPFRLGRVGGLRPSCLKGRPILAPSPGNARARPTCSHRTILPVPADSPRGFMAARPRRLARCGVRKC